MKKLSIIKKIITTKSGVIGLLYLAYKTENSFIWQADVRQALLLSIKEVLAIREKLFSYNDENITVDRLTVDRLTVKQAKIVKGYKFVEANIGDKQLATCKCCCNGSYSIHVKNTRKREAVEFTNHLPAILREQAQ